MFEDLIALVIGLALVAFAVVNAGGETTRRWVKMLGTTLFHDSALSQFIDRLADSRFGQTFYGTVVSIFAFFIGIVWVLLTINLLIGDFRRLR